MVKRGWFTNGMDFEVGFEIRKPNHLKSGQNCPNFEWSIFRVMTIVLAKATARPFKSRPFEIFGF